MSGETRFYVELPADEHGNVSMLPMAVVEAEFHEHGGPELFPCTNPARPVMVAHAPAEIVSRHPSWYEDAYGGWKEVGGPARIITRGEWEALTAEPGDIACGQANETGEDERS